MPQHPASPGSARVFFVDTCYWIARTNRYDQLHACAVAVAQALVPFRMVTTNYVLIEFLNYFAERGAMLRQSALRIVRRIQSDEEIFVSCLARWTCTDSVLIKVIASSIVLPFV